MRDGHRAADLWFLVQIARLQLAQPAQLVGGELEAVPFGDLRGEIDQQLALGAEGQCLPLQRLAGSLAGQAHVFELVALELVVETQRALQFGARAHHRLVAAEEGVELERDRAAFADRAGRELDAFGAVLLAGLGVAVGYAGIADGQAVDVQGQWLAARSGGCIRFGRWFAGLGGWRGLFGLPGRLANPLPVAAALFVTAQGQVEAVDGDVAHLHFAAQQRHYPHRQAEHAQVGERLLGCLCAGQGGLVQLQAEPGEQAPADVTFDVQFEAGLAACQVADLVLVVVGIE